MSNKRTIRQVGLAAVAGLASMLLLLFGLLQSGDTALASSDKITDHNAETHSAPQSSTTTFKFTLDAVQDNGDDEYGYEDNDFGDLTPDDFYFGRRYIIYYLKYEEAYDNIQFKLDDCLKPSELVSLKIGSETYDQSDLYFSRRSDDDCEKKRSKVQLFKFRALDNPVEDEDDYVVKLKVRSSGGSTTTPTPTPTAA